MLAPRQGAGAMHRWLYDELRGAILSRRLAPGSRLPGTRDLAARHGLSRGTVVAAIERLRAEGYVTAAVGSGTYVSTTLPAGGSARAAAPSGHPPARKLSVLGGRARPFPSSDVRRLRAFRANIPAVDLFPVAEWSRIASRRLRRLGAAELAGSDPMGHAPLREAVADYLRTSRGVACDTEQVVIVTGVQEALDLVARMVIDPGSRVCMEDPGYVGARLAFEAAGARLVPVPLDAEGMRDDPRLLRHARLIYVTPAHQFPLGLTMSLARRLALLERAAAEGALIFEDDYDSEFRYHARPMPALQGLDRRGAVLLAGTFGKVLFPSLRLGYLVLPPDLLDTARAIRSITAVHAPLLDQAALADFIIDGHFGRHLRRMRDLYAERLGVLVREVGRLLEGAMTVSDVEAGLQTSAWLEGGISGDAAARAAAARDIEVTPLGSYRIGAGPPLREGLQLGFAALDPETIRRGVIQLAAALEPLASL